MQDDKPAHRDDRRRFLRGTGAGIGVLLLGAGRNVNAAVSMAAAPSAFEAGPGSALIRVHASGAMKARIDFDTDAALKQARQSAVVNLVKANEYAGTLRLEGLKPGQTWFYRVVDAVTNQPLSAGGRFKTAPTALQPFTFAFSSCMHHDYKPFRLFDEIGRRDPDFFLHMGDTVYADQPRKQFAPSVAFYRSKHASSRNDEPLQRFLARHVTYAIWDDHEIENGAHAGHPAMADALQVFREYWPLEPAAADGLYRRFGWAGADFFMLDLRRFRSPQSMTDGPEKTMLGAAQKQWFLDALKTSTAPFKFIVTSVPFHGGSDDAWGIYKTERDEIAGFIGKQKVRGVVFLTGDYHMARDFSNPRTRLREYMAGPIANRPNYVKNPENRARVEKSGQFHYGDGNSFGFVRVDPRAERATLELADANGRNMFSVDLTP